MQNWVGQGNICGNMRIIILQQHMRQWPLQVLVGNNKVYRGRGGLTNTPHLLYTFVLPTRAGNASGQISIYICVCQYTVAANIQWQWSEATALTLPRPPRHLYHHQCHSLTSRPFHSLPQKKTRNTSQYFLCSICVLSVHPYVWPPSAAITVPQDSWAWPFPIPFTNVPSLILPSLLCTSSQWTCQPSSILLNPLRKRFWN